MSKFTSTRKITQHRRMLTWQFQHHSEPIAQSAKLQLDMVTEVGTEQHKHRMHTATSEYYCTSPNFSTQFRSVFSLLIGRSSLEQNNTRQTQMESRPWLPLLPVEVLPGDDFPTHRLQQSYWLPCDTTKPDLACYLQSAAQEALSVPTQPLALLNAVQAFCVMPCHIRR